MRMISIVIPVILSAVATGQQPSLTCLTDVGVYVKNGPTIVKFIPRGTHISKPTKLPAYTSGVSATVTMTPAISGRTASFVFREQAFKPGGQGTPSGGTATQVPNQPHAWLLEVPADAAGNVLVVTMKQASNSRPFGIVQLAQLDIGNDNRLEVNQDLSKAWVARTFQLGTGAVDIRIVAHSSLSNRYVQSYDFEIGLTLNPDVPLKISNYGSMCGMKLSMSGVVNGTGHIVSGRIDGVYDKRIAMLMFGFQQTAIPFPGHPCTILVNPVTAFPFPEVNGTVLFGFNVPGRIDGVIYLQAVTAWSGFGRTSIRMSNGVKIDGQ